MMIITIITMMMMWKLQAGKGRRVRPSVKVRLSPLLASGDVLPGDRDHDGDDDDDDEDEDDDGDEDENKDIIPSEDNWNQAEHKTF